MLSMILLNNKDDVVKLFSDITIEEGIPITLVVLFSRYIDWQTIDSSGNPSSEDDIVKLFKMNYNDIEQLFFPEVDDFECKFSFPAICTISSLFELNDEQSEIFYVDDVVIKSISSLESAYYASCPDEVD